MRTIRLYRSPLSMLLRWLQITALRFDIASTARFIGFLERDPIGKTYDTAAFRRRIEAMRCRVAQLEVM